MGIARAAAQEEAERLSLALDVAEAQAAGARGALAAAEAETAELRCALEGAEARAARLSDGEAARLDFETRLAAAEGGRRARARARGVGRRARARGRCDSGTGGGTVWESEEGPSPPGRRHREPSGEGPMDRLPATLGFVPIAAHLATGAHSRATSCVAVCDVMALLAFAVLCCHFPSMVSGVRTSVASAPMRFDIGYSQL